MKRTLLALGMLAAGMAAASAQNYPTKTIRVVVPFSAGSGTDIVARTIMDQLSQQLGQSIIVENRLGGGGTIGINSVAKAEPDGYTLLIQSTSFAVVASTYRNPGYDSKKDFAGITALVSLPNVLVVDPKKHKTVKDMVAYAKANPGKANYSSAGAGNSSHLNGELFRLAAGIEAVHLPFKGAPEAMTEVIAGRSDFYFAPLVNANPLLKDGQIVALAVSGSQRASALPDVPTTVQAGFANSEYNFWAGVFVPVKTPAAIKEKLYQEIAKALAHPNVASKLKELGADPMRITSAQYDALVKKEIETNSKIAKAANIRVN